MGAPPWLPVRPGAWRGQGSQASERFWTCWWGTMHGQLSVPPWVVLWSFVNAAFDQDSWKDDSWLKSTLNQNTFWITSVDGVPSDLFPPDNGPVRCHPGNQVSPVQGEGANANRGRGPGGPEGGHCGNSPWVSPLIMGNADLFKVNASITYWPWWVAWNKHQVMGQKGHQHRACIALTTWSPTPNMPPWHG